MLREVAGAALDFEEGSLDVGRSATLPDCGILVKGELGSGPLCHPS